MVYSAWLGVLGWGTFFIGLVAAIIIYAIKRKFYPIMYLVSIATYFFTVGFVIDAFDLDRDFVMLLLGFSAVLFILLGFYFSKKFSEKKEEFASRIPSKK
jgi:Kef-type K+ transport system membrane component KefB